MRHARDPSTVVRFDLLRGASLLSEGSVLNCDTNHAESAAFEAMKERKQPAVTEQLFQMSSLPIFPMRSW